MTDKNDSPERILDAIKNAKNILLSLHSGPDGDSLGSCTAMKYFLEKELDKKVTLISFDELTENMKGLSYVKEVKFGKDISDEEKKGYDLIIYLDSDYSYISGKLHDKYIPNKNIIKINIDHHLTSRYFGEFNYVKHELASNCSVLIELFKKWGSSFDSELCQRLLLGVVTDSGYFSYEGSESAIKDADFLISHGAKYVEGILKPILYNQPLSFLKYEAVLVNKLVINEKEKYGYVTLGKNELNYLKLNSSELKLGINYIQFIKELDFVFVLKEMDNFIKGSFRSKKGVDVSLFAKALGGGGHKPAAAFHIKSKSLDEALQIVINTIEKVGKKFD